MAKHSVGMRLDDQAFESLDLYAQRHRWSKSAAAEIIVSSFLALEEANVNVLPESLGLAFPTAAKAAESESEK